MAQVRRLIGNVKGQTGATPQISIGTVTDIPAGNPPTATMTGTPENPILNLGLVHGLSGNETIDDNAGIGDVDKVWSADKTAKEIREETTGIAVNVTDSIPEAVKTISDGTDNLPMSLKIGIEPVQDLHGQSMAYPAGGWKNLLNTETSTVNKAINESGEIVTLSGSSYTELIDVSAGQYTYSYLPAGSGTWKNRIHGYDSNGNWVEQLGVSDIQTSRVVSKTTITVPSTVSKVRISYQTSNTNIQFESGSTATDYAPYSNICPISGWTGCNATRTGKNLFNKNGTGEGYETGKWVNGRGELFAYSTWNTGEYTKILHNTTYTISGMTMSTQVSSQRGGFCYYDKNKQVVSGGGSYTGVTQTITTPDTAEYIRISWFSGSTAIGLPQLEKGSVASAYEPYQGSTYPITFPSSAGTVYGGEFTVKKDGTGELVVTHRGVDLGSLSWKVHNTNPFIFICDTVGTGKNAKFVNASTPVNGKCSMYELTAQTANVDSKISFNTSVMVYVKDYTSEGLSASQFKEKVSGEYLVYELATPSEPIPLSAPQVRSLLGINYILADTGDILSLEYSADTKTYVDAKTDALNAMIANSEAQIATESHAIGDVFICNNKLYKATDAIAIGETIVVGSNAVVTSIANELSAIWTAINA